MVNKVKIRQLFFLTYLFFELTLLKAQSAEQDFVFVKGGTFFIGSEIGDDDEKNGKKILIDDFFISPYEVTNKQYCDFLNAAKPDSSELRKYINTSGRYKEQRCRIYFQNGMYQLEKGFENYPITFVSWFGADAYCKFIGGRLPTEAEWEYVAKGGRQNVLQKLFSGRKYSEKEPFMDIAWFNENSKGKLHPVGQKKSNSLKLFDLSGNVAEWCSDWYSPDYYKQSDIKNPQGPGRGKMKIHRGGSWYNSKKILRVANRRASKPETKNALIGFRPVKSILPEHQ